MTFYITRIFIRHQFDQRFCLLELKNQIMIPKGIKMSESAYLSMDICEIDSVSKWEGFLVEEKEDDDDKFTWS